jgi:arabinose-5-phosphate isomerase
VDDIMLKGADLPKVGPGTTVRACLTEMSRGAIGVVGVTDAEGKLIGVFTDGDLRRTLDKNIDIHATRIADVMTPSPLAMKPNQLAAEAADLMEKRKINAILVVDDNGRLVGAFNMRILLRAGVV